MKFKIEKGKKKTPIRLVAYGPEGIGKSTLASQFPDPLFIDVEGGTYQLDVARFPQPETWDELIQMVDAVIEDPTLCKTLVIDTADKAEALLSQKLLSEAGVDSIEKYGGGYGKGYTAMAERFSKELLTRLDKVIAKGINVTILAHAAMRKFESPEEPPYDRWELKVSKKIAPLIKEWTDILVFLNYEVKVVEENGRAKARGKAKRTMICNHRPTCDAKNRFGLGDNLAMTFDSLKDIYDGNVEAKPEKTEYEIDTPSGIVDGDTREDPREVVLRRLKEKGIGQTEFEAWLVSSGRISNGSSYMEMSATMAKGMANNINVLIEQIRGGNNEA